MITGRTETAISPADLAKLRTAMRAINPKLKIACTGELLSAV